MSVEIDHLGIAVRSLEESLPFYRDLVGIPVASTDTVAAERVKVALLLADGAASGSRIELLEPTDAQSPIARFLDSRGPGLHHIALRVDNLTATAARLAAHGCQLLNEPRAGAGGHKYVFVHPRSAGGVLLELVQKEI